MPAVTPKDNAKAPTASIGSRPVVRKKDLADMDVTVWSPDGVKHRCPRHQANDLVRHLGWLTSPPKGMKGEVVEEEKVEEGGDEPQADAPAPEPDELDVLRAKLKDAGVEPDMRWGKKRLQEELAKGGEK